MTDGEEGCYAREVEQDEYQIGEGAGRSRVLLECLLKVAGVLWGFLSAFGFGFLNISLNSC